MGFQARARASNDSTRVVTPVVPLRGQIVRDSRTWKPLLRNESRRPGRAGKLRVQPAQSLQLVLHPAQLGQFVFDNDVGFFQIALLQFAKSVLTWSRDQWIS